MDKEVVDAMMVAFLVCAAVIVALFFMLVYATI